MRRFLKRLRKGIRTACLTAVLATCWNVGQPAEALATIEFVNFSGTVSPTENNLSHLFLIYGLNYSGFDCASGAIKLGDFPAGQTIAFSVFESGTAFPNSDMIWWTAVGLYGDISNEQYEEGINGVSIAFNGSGGESWDAYINEDEDVIFNYLFNDDIRSLDQFQLWLDNLWNGPYHNGWDFTNSKPLFDFSTASGNGEIYVESKVVPEPVTIILLGAGGIVVLCQRRDED